LTLAGAAFLLWKVRTMSSRGAPVCRVNTESQVCNADKVGRGMQWYVYLIAIAVTAFVGQVAIELASWPLRTVFRLRRKALERILFFRNMPLPRPREFAVSSRAIHDYDQAVAKVKQAQRTFSELGAQFLVLSESEPTIRVLMALFGLDIVLAGRELTNLSEVYATAKADSVELRREIERALHAASTALAVSRRSSRNDLTKIQLEPIYLRDTKYLRRRNGPSVGRVRPLENWLETSPPRNVRSAKGH
jgi:hypothetical protein